MSTTQPRRRLRLQPGCLKPQAQYAPTTFVTPPQNRQIKTPQPVYAAALGGPERKHLFMCTSESNDPAITRRKPGATIDIVDTDDAVLMGLIVWDRCDVDVIAAELVVGLDHGCKARLFSEMQHIGE